MNQHNYFREFMKLTKFRKNKQFSSKPQNLISIIAYIQNYLDLDDQSFVIIEDLIKQYGISILLCFQSFYQRIRQSKIQQAKQFSQRFQRIASLVKHTMKPNKFQELKFFQMFGYSTKGFKVKQKTEKQLFFLAKLQQIRDIDQNFEVQYRDKHPQMKLIERTQQLIQIQQTTLQNCFAQFYFDKMYNKTVSKFNKCYNKKLQWIKEKEYNIDHSVFQDKPMSKIQSTTVSFNKELTKEQIYNIDDSVSQDKSKIQSTTVSSNKDLQNSISQVKSFQQGKDTSSFSNLNQSSILPSKSNYDYKRKDQIKYIDFSKVNLCCRTFFFEDQQILQPESERIQFKCYRYPYSFQKVSIIRRTITSFLNRSGGIILIGIKEDVKTKSKIVLGEQYTQDDKQLILKTMRRITQKIYPDVCLSDPYVKTEFVPIRKGRNYFKPQQPYNFIENGYNSSQFQYKDGYYVIKVTVKPGKKDQLYWYSESNFSQNGQETISEYFAFRTENQVLRRQISQEMLSLYRDRLNGNITIPKPIHQYQCSKPEIGRPIQVKSKKDNYLQKQYGSKNIPQKRTEFNKQIQAIKINRGNRHKKQNSSSSGSKKHKNSVEKTTKHKKKKEHKKQEGYLDPNLNTHIPLIYDLQNVIKYPLYYVVLNMNQEKIVKTINKTPAKDFTTLTTTRDSLTGKPMYILKVASYSFLQKFLKIKRKIEEFFYKEKVQFVGVGEKIRIQNKMMRNQAQQILRKDVVLFIIQQNDVFRFCKVQTAASYCLKFMGMNIKFDALPQ